MGDLILEQLKKFVFGVLPPSVCCLRPQVAGALRL